jgi:hypothetical protein
MAEPREATVSLRSVLFVLVLVCMLSLNPVVTTQGFRIERAAVEYVLPRRRPCMRGRLRRRRDQARPACAFASIESFYSFQR